MIASLLPPPGQEPVPDPALTPTPTWALLFGSFIGIALVILWWTKARRWGVKRWSLTFWTVLCFCFIVGPLITKWLVRLGGP